MFLYLIPLIIAGIIAALLLIPLGLRMQCSVNDISSDEAPVILTLEILFIKLRLFPAKPKKTNPKAFRIKSFRKMRLKEEKKLEEKNKKERRRNEKKIAENEKKKKKSEEAAGISNSKRIKSLFETVFGLADKFFIPFRKYARLNFRRFEVTVSDVDCYSTALLYGGVSALAANFLTFMSENFRTDFGSVSVEPDFLSGKTKFYLDMELKMNLRQIIATVIPVILAFVGGK